MRVFYFVNKLNQLFFLISPQLIGALPHLCGEILDGGLVRLGCQGEADRIEGGGELLDVLSVDNQLQLVLALKGEMQQVTVNKHSANSNINLFNMFRIV